MRTLSFPDLVVERIRTVGRSGEWEPVPLAGVALGVHGFARYKNDCDLGPFFPRTAEEIERGSEARRSC